MSSNSFDVAIEEITLGFAASSDSSMVESINWGGVGGLGNRALQKILQALGEISFSSMTREEFLDKVSIAYDAIIAPAIIAMGPWGVFINPIVKAIVLSLAGKFYDNHS